MKAYQGAALASQKVTPRWAVTTHRALPLMLAASKRLGLPLKHARDLNVHDVAHLARLRGDETFVWILYEHGTFLFCAGHRDGVNAGPADFVKSIARDYPEARFFIWDGVDLHPQPNWQQTAACIRETEQRMREPRRMVECALCCARVPFEQTFSPADEAICAVCNDEVRGKP